MTKRLFVLAVAAASMFAAAPTWAASLLYQSIPDLTVKPTVNAWCSNCGQNGQPPARMHDEFTLSASATVSEVTFVVKSNFGGWPRAVDLAIWQGPSSGPGTLVAGWTVAPADFLSLSNTAFDTAVVSVAAPNIALAGSTLYNISFFATDLGIPGFSNAGGRLFQQGYSAQYGSSAGFALSAVPEPGAWGLMIAGFGGVGFVLRRRSVIGTA